MRYAIYFTPSQDEPLARIAANWLGRDPFSAATRPVEAVDDLSAAEVAFHTASARRYGFHSTLKAPFRLAPTRRKARCAPRSTVLPKRRPRSQSRALSLARSTASLRW